MEAQAGRDLVGQTLRVVQGHPKLLELAGGQAADPAVLAARLDEADQVWAEGDTRLPAFLDKGESAATADGFLRVLMAGPGRSPRACRRLQGCCFGVLCYLEEADRTSQILGATWARIWRRLRPSGDVPPVEPTMGALAASGLVNLQDSPTSPPAQQPRVVGTGCTPVWPPPDGRPPMRQLPPQWIGNSAHTGSGWSMPGWDRQPGRPGAW